MRKSFMLIAASAALFTAAPAAFADNCGCGPQHRPQRPLIDVNANVGGHRGGLVNADVNVGGRRGLVDADVNVLGAGHRGRGSLVDADVNVGGRNGLLNVDANVGSNNRRNGSLLNVDVRALGGGVGH